MDRNDNKWFFPGSTYVPKEDLCEVHCPECGGLWVVHRDLSGFRIRCKECGSMIEVPEAAESLSRDEFPDSLNDLPALQDKEKQRTGSVNLPVPFLKKDFPEKELDEIDDLKLRRRIINRLFIELIAVMLAFVLPILVLYFGTAGPDRLILHPLTSVVSGVLVLIIISVAAPGIYRYIRRFRIMFLAEAGVAVGVLLFLAWVWTLAVRKYYPGVEHTPFKDIADQWGVAWLIFMVGLCPGIFEELAFRGLLQSRFDLLTGPYKSILYTAIAFALCHTVTFAFPIHLLAGIYLSYLRFRSKSLIPGMIVHSLYNSLVLICIDGI